jgi:hypothetical protein
MRLRWSMVNPAGVIHLTAALSRQFSARGGPSRRQAGNLIALFTDFGLHGPYTGQMKAVLHQMAPGTSIVDLFADAPRATPRHRLTCWRSMSLE